MKHPMQPLGYAKQLIVDLANDGERLRSLKLYIFWELDEEGQMAIVPATSPDEAKEEVAKDGSFEVDELPEPEEYALGGGPVYYSPYAA